MGGVMMAQGESLKWQLGNRTSTWVFKPLLSDNKSSQSAGRQSFWKSLPQRSVELRLIHLWIIFLRRKIGAVSLATVIACNRETAQKPELHDSLLPCAHYAFDLSPPKRKNKTSWQLSSINESLLLCLLFCRMQSVVWVTGPNPPSLKTRVK